MKFAEFVHNFLFLNLLVEAVEQVPEAAHALWSLLNEVPVGMTVIFAAAYLFLRALESHHQSPPVRKTDARRRLPRRRGNR